jgi:hypothetical protein
VGLALARLDPAATEAAAEKVEEHTPVRIRPGHEGQTLAHPNPDSQLLIELPLEAGLERFPEGTFPTRELPEPAEVLPRIAPRHEKTSTALDNRRRHLDYREAGARGELTEQREERGPVGRPRAAVPARICWM